MPKLRVLVTGGGTGGHIYPIIAVASELQILAAGLKIETDIRYLGVYGPYRQLLAENEVKVQGIVGSKLRRYFSLTNFIDGPKFLIGLFQALSSIFWFMPDVVFSKGGPGALSVVLAARFYRIPVIIHESDTVPGMTNLISGRFAKLITIAFPGAAQYFKNREVVLIGNPVRRYLLSEKISEQTAKGVLEFNPELPLLLVLGGSQGAMRINDFILSILPQLLPSTQVLHQTGRNNYEAVFNNAQTVLKELSSELKGRYRAIDFFEKDIRLAMAAADVIVSRAGAGSIFEIAAFGKPSILIPLPEEVVGNHQILNASEYASSAAAIVIEEANLLPNLFLEQLKGLLGDNQKLHMMSEAALQFAKPEAASNLAQIILKLRGYGS